MSDLFGKSYQVWRVGIEKPELVEGYIENKMKLSYFDNKKSAPLILFIHGTASAHEMWDRQYKSLSATHFRVIGIDLRGHGKSSNPGGACNLDDHISDLKETLDHIEIKEPIAIVGHSFGAILAVKFAEKYPELVSRLLLVSLPARVPWILIKYYKWLLGKPLEILNKKINLILKLPVKRRLKLAISTDINIIREIWRESMKWDFLNQVPKINCPVYLSVGRFDYVALRSMVKRLHQELPNSSYKVFNWSSHTCMEDEPAEFNNWVLSSLALPVR